MTFWATLYYSGYVVISMGFPGQTLDQCQELTSRMMSDIVVSYEDPVPELVASPFPTNEFTVECETERLPVDERF
tara:strand:- start:738 stop:962 length:225 start_codon:yes stop_codon:yes gene_type:complete